MNTNASRRRAADRLRPTAAQSPTGERKPSPGVRKARKAPTPSDAPPYSTQALSRLDVRDAVLALAWPLAWRIALINVALFAAAFFLLVLLGVVTT